MHHQQQRPRESVFVPALILSVFVVATRAGAWDQPVHKQINAEAIKVFLDEFSETDKYDRSFITEEGRREQYRGIAVTSYTLFQEPYLSLLERYEIAEANYTMPRWIIHGGDWADEPHLYASVRHFYDPFKITGVHWLMDQFWVHGMYENPKTDAITWGLEHPDNPFGLFQGMAWYKLALETADDLPLPPALLQEHFKLALVLTASNPQEQREIYLALAYRALGETMHMLADMTQPAHVRNDAHPMDEPIESRIFTEHVREAALHPLIDSRIQCFLASAGGDLQTPRQLFHKVAVFTNMYFYSLDTIYDEATNILPNNFNIEQFNSYTRPQFKDLVVDSAVVQGFVGQRTVKKLYGEFNGVRIPMAQERLSFHWFDPDQSIFIDPREVGGRYCSRLGPYHIPNAYAPEQGSVLLSNAIYACADLMELFFPTLKLEAEYDDQGIQESDTPGQSGNHRRVIAIKASMTHFQDDDLGWKAFDLKINYTGPGALVISRDGHELRRLKLHFKNGALDKIESADGTLIKAPLKVYVPVGTAESSVDEVPYVLHDREEVHIEVTAGSRLFTSLPWKAQGYSVAIEPPKIVVYELLQGANQVTHEFEAEAAPPGFYRFEWDFGDGTGLSDLPGLLTDAGHFSRVSHTYTNLKDGDVFLPSVKLFHETELFLAEDGMTIRFIAGESTEGEAEDPLDYCCSWPVDFSQLRRSDSGKYITYKNAAGQLHGPYFAFRDTTRSQLQTAMCWFEGKSHGIRIDYWWSGNKQSEVTWVHGEKDGPFKEWHENGVKSVEGTYKDWEYEGVTTCWYDNGQMRQQGSYQNGLQEGFWQSWHDNGQLAGECSFTNGLLEGFLQAWHTNGQLAHEGSYKEGRPIGVHYYWNEDGSLDYSTDFG